MRRYLYVFFGTVALTGSAVAAGPGLEYRFKAQDGVEFKWRDGKVEKLDRQPFIVTSDFVNAIPIKSTAPNSPGSFEVDIVHNKPGKAKYRATAEVDPPRDYCVVFRDTVLQCYELAPKFAGLYEQGSTIYGPFSKAQAEGLAREIRSTLR